MTLPEDFKHFFASWEATGKEERTLRNLTSRLCMEECRLGIQPLKTDAFVAKRSNKKFFKQGQQNQNANKNLKGKCFICNIFGHWKRDCPNKSHKKSGGGDAFVGEHLFVVSSEENAWFSLSDVAKKKIILCKYGMKECVIKENITLKEIINILKNIVPF